MLEKTESNKIIKKEQQIDTVANEVKFTVTTQRGNYNEIKDDSSEFCRKF